MCETPPRSPTIVGMAVETIVWSRLDISMPASSAEKMMLIRRRVSTIGGAATSVGGACMVLLGTWVGRLPPRCGERGENGSAGSAGWCGQPGGQDVPGLLDQRGQ